MKPIAPSHRAAGGMMLLLASGGAMEAVASTASSAQYSITPMALGAGGGVASSASYSVHADVSGEAIGTSTSTAYSARHGFPAMAFGLARVAGRRVFYNGSAWDGFTSGADPRDDLAIAPDKAALLPGQTATFAHYTSSAAGINALMVDIDGVGGPLLASDFSFRTGNTADPATWTAGPAPASVSLRPGAGIGGSTRVTVLWPDGSIRNQWLEVRVLATGRTDLDAVDRFYFGNAVGETGDRPGADAVVDASDETRTRQNVRSLFFPAPLDSAFDFNRDRQVDATDQILARANATGSGVPLVLLTAPVAGVSGGGGSLPALSGPQETQPGLVALVQHGPVGWISIEPAGSLPAGLRLEWSDQPAGRPWLPVTQALRTMGANGVQGWSVPAEGASGSARFFRLVSDPSSNVASQNP